MTLLIKAKNVRTFALALAQMKRPRFTRVSKAFIEKLDGELKIKIMNYIITLPSKGKTIK